MVAKAGGGGADSHRQPFIRAHLSRSQQTDAQAADCALSCIRQTASLTAGLCRYTSSVGLRTAVASVTGRDQESAARWTDPFGVRIGLNSAHAQSLLTWQDYAAKFKAVAATTVRFAAAPAVSLLPFLTHSVFRSLKSSRTLH